MIEGRDVPRSLLTLTAITFVTWIGTRMTAVALPLVALAETGDAWTTGLVGGVSGVPLLTVGWWGRRFRDRLTCGRALAVALVVQSLGLAIVPMAAVLGQVNATSLCASGVVTGAAGALLGPAQRALVSDLADSGRTRGRAGTAARWLAWQDLAHRVSMIFAPPAAAWLLAVTSAESLLWIETVVMLSAAAAMLTVSGAASATAIDRSYNGAGPGAGTPKGSAISVLRSHSQIAVSVFMAGIGGLCWFGFSLGLAILGAEHGMPGELIAAGMSGYGMTSVLSSLFIPVFVDRLPRMPTIVVSWILLGLSFTVVPWAAPEPMIVAIVGAAGGAAVPWGIAMLNALISEQTAGAERRAAFMAETIAHSGGVSIGLLVGGAVIGWTGAPAVLIATGIAQIAAAIGGYVIIRSGRRADERSAHPQMRLAAHAETTRR